MIMAKLGRENLQRGYLCLLIKSQSTKWTTPQRHPASQGERHQHDSLLSTGSRGRLRKAHLQNKGRESKRGRNYAEPIKCENSGWSPHLLFLYHFLLSVSPETLNFKSVLLFIMHVTPKHIDTQKLGGRITRWGGVPSGSLSSPDCSLKFHLPLGVCVLLLSHTVTQGLKCKHKTFLLALCYIAEKTLSILKGKINICNIRILFKKPKNSSIHKTCEIATPVDIIFQKNLSIWAGGGRGCSYPNWVCVLGM